MRLDTRLDRLTPALSGKERAILVLRTFKEKKPQDQRMGQGMGPAEAREYNRLIRLMNACNTEVLISVILLREQAAKIGLKIGWLATLDVWGEHAEVVSGLLKGLAKTRKAAREALRRMTVSLPGVEGGEDVPLYETMAEVLRQRLPRDVETAWTEVKALDAALVKVAQEFDGEDVLRPETRADLDETIENLKEAHTHLQHLGVAFELPALDEDEVGANLEFIRYFAER